MSRQSPIVFALDFASVVEAERAAMRVREAIGMVKVGLELFVEAGPRAMAIGEACGLPVFLDLKLCDIPETVERAVARAAALGARVLTVHASGGPAMLSRAVKSAESAGTGLQIAAVTVLTSLDVGDLGRMGIAGDVLGHVRKLARLAFDEGVRAFVCSPREVAAVRQELGPGAMLITPGVRPSESTGGDDQKRVATPARAAADGANWLVVGRPIRDAADPLAVARAMRDEALEAMRA
ncbi:MAG: orotidine-5'-phosphate decarboxylase [Polyangiaceae bacterium]